MFVWESFFKNIGISLATLKLVGTIPDDKEVWNKVAKGTDITPLRILSVFTGRLYWPVALPGFILEIWVSISTEVTGNKKNYLRDF